MSVFIQLDERLASFATGQHARLTRDRDGSTLQPRANNSGFEERRIDWKRDEFNVAILIQPHFEGMTIDTSRWHFIAVAWVHVVGRGKHVAELRLVSGRPFPEIEACVDELLAAALTLLNGLQRHDLRPLGFE
ncbi:hypothetical protein [Hymenobacter cellulosilyticus]|uniref:Uncharacterized protein n=1 Tax=Hymenobacter cellulosilyticus TaxID=2932248 RepID=A0A8T9Q4H4_9BACT|nr:hypothetical protein [Hymenobacter cellulosilyticus]UOQ71331.1 hypothetical protein MUN79_22280 [Hymenobacter cellulosilyticus]